MISSSAGSFLGFVFETLFFGVFLIVFGISTNLQWTQHKHDPLSFGNRLVFAFSILLCLFITTHWWLNLWGIYVAFLQTPDATARELYFNNLGAALSLTRLTIYEIQTWMGDILLIFRLYHVAGRKWIMVIPPVVLTAGAIICSAHFLYYSSKIDLTQPQTLLGILWLEKKWSIATFSLMVAENFYCLGFIAFFIWRAHRGGHRSTSSSLQPVLQIFIESAGIWVFCILVIFIVYLTSGLALYIPLYPANPLLGVAFCMIIIHLQLRDKGTVVGSGSSKPPYFGSSRTASKE